MEYKVVIGEIILGCIYYRGKDYKFVPWVVNSPGAEIVKNNRYATLDEIHEAIRKLLPFECGKYVYVVGE